MNPHLTNFNSATGSKREMAERAPALNWPSEVMLDLPSATLQLVWGGVRASITHATLRSNCKCAECGALRRNGRPAGQAEGVTVTRLEPAGEAGLRFFFSDGHDRGIFPWGYLFALAYGPR